MRPTPGLLILLALILPACSDSQPRPPTTLLPPTIEIAGVVTSVSQDNEAAYYVLAGGREFAARFSETRLLEGSGSWGGDMVVAGKDSVGRFVVARMTQGGLPADCYVDNSRGIDRGSFIELNEVLWKKAGDFIQGQPVRPDYTYPGATRFCFNPNAEVTRTIAP